MHRVGVLLTHLAPPKTPRAAQLSANKACYDCAASVVRAVPSSVDRVERPRHFGSVSAHVLQDLRAALGSEV